MGSTNSEKVELLQAQEEVCKHLFAYADSLVLRAAIELRIADIIHSNGQPMSLSEIASKLEAPSPKLSSLARIMRVLVRKKIFTVDFEKVSLSPGDDEPGEPLYGLTLASKCLLHDQELSFAPIFLTFTHPVMVDGWFEIGRSIKEGGTPFELAHGAPLWEMTSKDASVNKLFIAGMTAATNSSLDAIISEYKDNNIF
ncbi:desmethylxanthohumol 6'-O-methyltransferase-like [Chenopodium quinoa]|uniref:desmethylxanthohumol 6'-O-methyltransferase-like n=1 Tax=Chenopodium quinoa TaxID=63459 RepID=UPI000B7733D5|nr:desmethylxanthohumol 6'-O-methyltransferase-like [Chenopodium quinoa]